MQPMLVLADNGKLIVYSAFVLFFFLTHASCVTATKTETQIIGNATADTRDRHAQNSLG